MSEVHAQARTTPRTRSEIKDSQASLVVLAETYNISVATARKWKRRECPEDLSHRPHKLSTTLTPGQEAITVELRRLTLLPLDDLVAVVREFINPDVSRSGLDRCLRRHGVGNLRDLQAQALADAGETQAPIKTFKDYEPGFLHMDIKYLPQMPDESQRRYLFVAIDRATRWVFMRIYADQSENSSVDFLNHLEHAAPMKIVKLLTDNGSQFTDRFTSKKREPTGHHSFDVRCKALAIEHRLCPPRHPQTNGMVERFNGRISEVVKQTKFASAAELEATLENYVKIYNHQIPQRALKHLSPVQALKIWHKKKPPALKVQVQHLPWRICCMPKTYTHLSLEERALIQVLLEHNLSLRAIARKLRRAASTVTREFSRNHGRLPDVSSAPAPGRPVIAGGYRCAPAHQRAKRMACKPRVARKMVYDNAVWNRVLESLRGGLSPEQASGILQRMPDPVRISHETIYTALYAMPRGELRAQVLALLPRGHKTRRPRSGGTDRRGLIPGALSIDERPIEVSERLVPGHWEGDLIKGARNQSQIGTLVERKTLYTVLVQLDNATAEHTAQRFGFVLNRLDAAMRLSMTYDNGKEMAHHQSLSQSTGIKVFFAHPYSPWERGINENTNGLLRRVLPKGTDLSIYTQEQLDAIAFHHNAKPRKSLAWKSPAELFLPEGSFDFQAYWSTIINPVALGA